MRKPLIVTAFLSLAACAVAAQEPDTCYENGAVDAARTAQWQAALAARDSDLMARLAGNWSNDMSAIIDNVLSRARFEQTLAANGVQSSRATTCSVSSDAPCRVREESGTWTASQSSDGTITLATRDDVGERPGFCMMLDVRLASDFQLVFAGAGAGDYLTRN